MFRGIVAAFLSMIVLLASAAVAAPPALISTVPTAGATGVDPLLGSISLNFDQPMRNQGSLAISGPWGVGELLLVGDRTFFHSRSNPGSELPAGATITVTVNPAGSTNPFVNLAGQAAATTTFSFTIAPGLASPRVISSVPSRGAIGVDSALGSIAVQFSEPMNPTYRSFTLPAAWGTSSESWTPDFRTLTILRDDTSQPLPARDLITLVLSPTGSINSFRDFDGNLLPKTTIEFGVEPYEHFPAVLATDPPNGAVGVSASRTNFTVTFGEPMTNAVSLSTSPRWGASTFSWSGDRRTLTVNRISTTPLFADSRIEVNLNVTPGQIDWLMPPGFLGNPRGDRLPAYSFAFQVAAQSSPAVVTATTPANGAVVDDPFLDEILIQFDRPMQPFGCAGLSTTGDEWQGLPGSWSPDQRSFRLVRSNPQAILRTGKEITIRLNPQECGNDPSFLFRGTDGHLLGVYTFTFTIGDGESELFAVPSDPAQGFSWPYYLGVPTALTADAALLVEPNNTGAASDDLAVHDRAAEALALGRANHMGDLGVPWLVPVFPRPVTPSVYTHVLDRDTLQTTSPGLGRIDRQLIAMIADARRRLAERDLTLAPRILMNGFSASGAFAHRFTALHPELVKATASGSGAGWPIAPVAAWDRIDLRYPVGIADLTSLVGAPFSAAAYRGVPLFLYVGTADANDPVPGWEPIDRDAVYALTGVSSGPIWPRWVVSNEIHLGAGMTAARFAIYPGVGHTVTSAMAADVQEFLRDPLPEPDVASGLFATLMALAALARAKHVRSSLDANAPRRSAPPSRWSSTGQSEPPPARPGGSPHRACPAR